MITINNKKRFLLKRYESCTPLIKILQGMDNKMIIYNVIKQSVEFFEVVKLIDIYVTVYL